MRSDQQSTGRYVQGGKAQVRGDKLGWWEPVKFPKSQSDVPFTITRRYVGRPDLLAYDVYGSANLQWFILQYNAVLDLFNDFGEGKVILLPTKARLFGDLLTKSRV